MGNVEDIQLMVSSEKIIIYIYILRIFIVDIYKTPKFYRNTVPVQHDAGDATKPEP